MDSNAYSKWAGNLVFKLVGIGVVLGIVLVGIAVCLWWLWDNVSLVIK